MEFALANHSKVMQIRFDLHYSSDGSILLPLMTYLISVITFHEG